MEIQVETKTGLLPDEGASGNIVDETTKGQSQESNLEVSNDKKEPESMDVIRKYPFDFMAWKSFIGELEAPANEESDEEWKLVFDHCLEKMPPIPSLWLELIRKVKLHPSKSASLALVFKNGLCKVRSLELCKKYISYIKNVRNILINNSQQQQKLDAVLSEAYELVLDRVGHETDSGSLWHEYILYLKSNKTDNAYEEQRNIDLIRSTYQRAINTPIFNIEKIWAEYDQFENSLNNLTAKKIISSKSTAYLNVRSALCDLKIHYNTISKLKKMVPNTIHLKWSKHTVQLYDAWMVLINWEKSNPIKYEDKNICQTRVMATYDKALMQLRNFPEIWYEATKYYFSINKDNLAINTLKMGLEAIPYSLILNLYYIQYLESISVDIAVIYETFDKLIGVLESRIDDVIIKSLENKKTPFVDEDKSDSSDADAKFTVENIDNVHVTNKATLENNRTLLDRKNNLSIAWIHYIHTARRLQGIKAARSVFNRARKNEHCTYHLWVVSAKMEYYYNKDPITAGKVLQVGMKKFATGQDTQLSGLLNHYLDFLIAMNDDGSTRAFIMNTLGQKEIAHMHKQLWERSIKFETENGTLANIQKLENMRADALADENPIDKRSYLAERWTFLDIDTIARNELGIDARLRVSTNTNLPKQQENAVEPNVENKTHHDQTSVIQKAATNTIAQTKSDTATQKKKKVNQTLKSVDPEKYPCPDLNSWVPVNVTHQIQNSSEINIQPQSTNWPMNPPVIPNYMPPTMGGLPQNLNTFPTSNNVNLLNTNILTIYPAIAQLLSQLPPASEYDGPTIFVDECLGLINNADVPLPQVIPKPVSWVIHNNTRDHPYQHTNELSSDQNNTTTNDNYMDNQQHIMDNFYQRRNQPMVPGYDNVNMQGYMQQQQIPQFDDRWAFNNEKDKNWKRGGRSMRASGRSGRNFGFVGDKSAGRNSKKKLRGANSQPIGIPR